MPGDGTAYAWRDTRDGQRPTQRAGEHRAVALLDRAEAGHVDHTEDVI